MLKATTALNEYLDWPGVAQVGQVESKVVKDGKTTHALLHHQCFKTGGRRRDSCSNGPGGIGRSRIVLTTYVTSQWARTPSGSASVPVLRMAAFRNATIGLLRTMGVTNIAEHFAATLLKWVNSSPDWAS